MLLLFKRIKCVLKEGCFPGLTRREKDDVSPFFYAIDEVSELFRTSDDVVGFRIHGAAGFKISHFLLLNSVSIEMVNMGIISDTGVKVNS